MSARLALLAIVLAFAGVAAGNDCGEVVTLRTHGESTTRYGLAQPKAGAPEPKIALVLLPGGGGHLDLDDKGCPRALGGNSLVQSVPHFQALGLVTALVDAPSDHPGDDGLAGFRMTAEHAEDIGKVIADVRSRAKAPVWLVGTSRGAISAANIAARLSGPAAPDGLVLTSAVMFGNPSGVRPWVSHTVFAARLEDIRMPVLLVGHAFDSCTRSPARLMADVAARVAAPRKEVVTVSGGPFTSLGPPSLGTCAGRSPHAFYQQEAEVAAGMARFMRGGTFAP